MAETLTIQEDRRVKPAGVPGSPSFVNRLTHILVGLWCKPLWGPDYQGLERVPREGRLIVACNHRHWMDTLILPLTLQHARYSRFLGKDELFRHAPVAWLMRQLGIIRLNRQRGDVAALKQAVEVLEDEGCLGLFPEGTRSRTGVPGRAKAGVGFLAYRTGALVVPARVWNTEKFPRAARMRVKYGAPMKYEGDGSRESCQRFADSVMEAIFKLEWGAIKGSPSGAGGTPTPELGEVSSRRKASRGIGEDP